MFTPIQSLTKETILSKVDEYSILKHLLPEFKGVGSYRSNLRTDDNNNSLNVTVRKGKIVISDFGVPDSIGLNIINYAKKVFGYPDTKEGYMATLSTIADNFNLNDVDRYNKLPNTFKRNGTIYNVTLEDKQETIIRYKSREYFSFKKDYEFWQPLLKVLPENDLIELFRTFNIIFISHYWINDRMFTVKESSPTYCYRYKNKRKLYSPYEKDFKWINNIPKDVVEHLDLLPETGDILIIDKSKKDSLINHILGYNTLHTISESAFLPEEVIKNLKQRFKRIYIHFDNDKAGINSAMKFAEMYDLQYYYFPKELGKDNFNVLEQHNLKVLEEYLITIFN